MLHGSIDTEWYLLDLSDCFNFFYRYLVYAIANRQVSRVRKFLFTQLLRYF
jgi:hypothetical protein